MIKAQHNHRYRQDTHDNHPGIAVCNEIRHRAGSTFGGEHVDKVTRQVDQAAGCRQFGDVVECTLPADIFRLLGRRQLTHIHPVAGNIVGCATECHNRQEDYRHQEKMFHSQRQCHKTESHTGYNLCGNNIEFFGFKQFQKRAPQRFQCPWQENQRCPKGNQGILHTHTLKHQHSGHVQHHKWQTHCEIRRRHPCYRADALCFVLRHSCYRVIVIYGFSLAGLISLTSQTNQTYKAEAN